MRRHRLPASFSDQLPRDLGCPSGVQSRKNRQQGACERRQVLDSVAVSNENSDGEGKPAQVLLMLEIRGSPAKQRAVADAGPAYLWNGAHVVPFQEPSELPPNRLIEQNSHAL